MKETFLDFLNELAPEARLRLYDSAYYLRPLNTESASPDEARAVLDDIGRPQRLGIAPRRVGPEKVNNLLILTDPQRTGLWRIAHYFDIEHAIIAVPDHLQPQQRKQALHLVVHRRSEYLLRPWLRRKEAAQDMEQLADETGGEVWFFRDPRELTKTYRRAADRIRSSYTLGYYSNAPPGRHRLRVEVPGRSLTLRSRQLVVTD
jgi:hypothetical protein